MSYSTGQITSQADPYEELLTVIEAMLTAHSAWTFVKEVTAGSVFRVWRNLGTENAWGQDFYVAFRKSSVTVMILQVCEHFDDVGDLAYRPAVNPASTYTPHTDGSWGDTGLALNSTIFNTKLDVGMSTVDFNYWVIVTTNGIFVNSTAASYPGYVGLFEPMHPDHPDEFPLTAWDIGFGDADGAGSVSRRPSVTVSMTDAFAIYSHYATQTIWTSIEGSVPNGLPVLYNDKALGSRFAVYHTNSTNGSYRGWMYDALIFAVEAGVEPGDTMTVDAQVYVYLQNNIWANTDAI